MDDTLNDAPSSAIEPPDTAGRAMLEMSGVVKSFGAHTVLHGVSLSVAVGKTVVVIGPSGSGKTTLLRWSGICWTPGVVRGNAWRSAISRRCARGSASCSRAITCSRT